MGFVMSKAMDENLKKNQAFMAETQRMTMERQIQMQNLMREKMMAMQMARARDVFAWFGSFYSVAGVGMIVGFMKKKNPGMIAPLVPLTFILGYQYDLAYGNKMERIKVEADNILQHEMGMLEIPGGVPTISQIEERRKGSSA